MDMEVKNCLPKASAPEFIPILNALMDLSIIKFVKASCPQDLKP